MSIESRSKQYGAIFGDWHIGKKLGSGSNGKSAVFELYRNHEGWQERSALKVISLIEEQGNQTDMSEYRRNEYSTASQNRRSAAEQEVRLMDQVRGKTNIVDYLDHKFFEWTDEDGFGADMLIRMELLTDLRSMIKNDRSFTEQEITQIGRDICQALVICHEKNILHRDIKPENIFVSADGDYKLGDFGVSRMMKNVSSSMASTNIGTPAYAAPEQVTGHYDTRVDIYSLGLVLYELSNGNRLPFAQSRYLTEAEIQLRLAGKPLPAPAGASAELWEVIRKACAYKPEDRYQHAGELARALENLGGAAPVYGSKSESYDAYATEKVHAEAEMMTGSIFDASQATGSMFDASQETEPMFDDPPPASPARDLNATQYAKVNNQNWNRSSQTPQQPPKSEPKKMKYWPLLLVLFGAALFVALLPLFSSTGQHQHSWENATCTKARTCEECGETKGSALGHLWTEATCLTPKTCQRCGITTGSASSHTWRDATYDAPKTCITCGITQGEPLEKPVETATGIVDIAVGGWATYALTSKGRVYAIGENQYGQSEVSYFTDIVNIAAGDGHVALLHKNGTVSTVGHWQNGQGEVAGWRDIVDIDASSYCTVGIRKNGTVALAGRNQKVNFNVSGWTNIVQVAATDYFIVGLRSDGTVVYTGGNGHEGQASYYENAYRYSPNGNASEVATWRNIVQVAAGRYHTLGLRADGTVVATTPAYGEFPAACDVSGWTDIVAICAGSSFSVGLRSDGTVVVAGDFCDKNKISIWSGNISTPRSWRNVVQITAFYNQIIGLTKDGYVVACGFNSPGLCDVDKLHKKIFADSN